MQNNDKESLPVPNKIACDPRVEIMTVTPQMAERWLPANTRNRHIRWKAVDRYAEDMASGRWRFTGEGIKFSRSGRLLDGQHRLLAIVKSGASVQMVVSTNLDEDAQDNMDTNIKRSGADMLSWREIKNPSIVSALCRVIAVGLDDTSAISHGRILEMIQNDPSIEAACENAKALNVRVPPTTLAYAYWRLQQVDPVDVDRFFASWSTLENLSSGSPILALNRRLALTTGAPRAKKVQKDHVASIFIAWNAWRKGEARMLIKVPRKEDGSISFPTPI